jgi:hypothetical protein
VRDDAPAEDLERFLFGGGWDPDIPEEGVGAEPLEPIPAAHLADVRAVDRGVALRVQQEEEAGE